MAEQEQNPALDPVAWERRKAACRKALSPLGWLVGHWRGRGEQDGSPRISDVETQLLFDNTFIQSRERIYTADGQLEHEDLTIYGASPEDPSGELWAHLYMLGGMIVGYRVEVLGESVLCEPDGFGARLSIQRDGDDYVVRIFYPDGHGNWVEDAAMHYQRYE